MRILERISTCLSIAIFTICCGLFLLFGISGTGWKALSIPTGSMRPDIPPGSLVLVHRVPISSLRIGDVITYINPLKPSTTLTHRIVKTYTVNGKVPGFVTKGDANKFDDVPITAGSIEGQEVMHIPHLGSVLLDAKKPYVILPIIYAVAILIMFEEVIRLKDYLKQKQPYKLARFRVEKKSTGILHRKLTYVGASVAAFVIMSGLSAPVALALLKTNTVTLGPNNLVVAPNTVTQCGGNTTDTNNVNVTNNSSQSSSSGNATVTGNGTATSGNASNSSSSNITITVTNNC